MKVIAKPVDMIWHTDIEGAITPIKFNIREKDGIKRSYLVLRVRERKLTRIAGCKHLNFYCEIEVQHRIRLCEIRYELDSCKWVLFKCDK